MVCCFGFLVVIVLFWLVVWVIVVVALVVVVVVGFSFGWWWWLSFGWLDLDCSILGLGLNDGTQVVEKERQRGKRVCSFIFILWIKFSYKISYSLKLQSYSIK